MYILQYVCPSLLQQQSKLAQLDELIKMFNSETGKKEKIEVSLYIRSFVYGLVK